MTTYRSRPPALLGLTRLLPIVALVAPIMSAPAAQFLRFEAVSRDQGAELVGGGQTVLRLRPGMKINGGTAALATELNRLALAGLQPAALTVRTLPTGVQIVAGKTPLLLIDKATARLAGTTPDALAAEWLANLKAVLASPYVVLTPADGLAVPLGETRQLRWGGTAGVDITFAVSDTTVASVQLAEQGNALIVQGLKPGAVMLTASLDGAARNLPVEVRAWAARIAPRIVAEITAPPLPEDDLRRTLRNAVLSGLQPAPGASIELGEPRRVGDGYAMPLHAAGEGCFEVNCAVPVDVRAVKLSLPPPQQLLVSNLPEKIAEPGTLLRERLVGKVPVRLLWHHVNFSGRPLRFAVRVINRGDTPARLHVTEAASGPHHDEIHVGHSAAWRYLALAAQGEGYVLNLPAGRMLDLYDTRLPVDYIVSGVGQITLLEGTDLLLEVLAEDSWPTDAYFAAIPQRLKDDPPLTPYCF